MQKQSKKNNISRFSRRRRGKDLIAQIIRDPAAHTDRVTSVVQTYSPNTTNFIVSGSGTYSVTGGLGYFVGPGASALDAAFALQFSLNDLAQTSQWSVLYDAYRIKRVLVRMYPDGTVAPQCSSLGAASTATAKIENLHTVIDYDDQNTLSSLAAAMEYESFAITRACDPLEIEFGPRVAETVFRTGVTSGYAQPKSAVWLDMATTDVPHYGLKGYVVSTGAAQNIQNVWTVYVTAEIEFKQVK